ncbi:hypothetical protein [Pseudodesulfovibrio sp.]|uniref:hypothetical protein n=1 Tax=Pseudodesulfovibrio sp. TaxID=2035812 RepID=UPI0026337858|nr:hypothetical protein [Pseudodesulfovibrio sp.]MDD3311691.1 hypothetical protein [Pseudodesulfovibrio sp.]
MKIEMGESLVRTWARHCRECQLAELNWKPSPLWTGAVTDEHREWFRAARAEFPAVVFKKNAGISQFLGQAEIDVLGVHFEQGRAGWILAADIAFHSEGLRYGSTDETSARIIKKLFRSALVIDRYFPQAAAEICFLSPRVNPGVVPGVVGAVQTVQAFFGERRERFRFRAVINDEFGSEVVDRVASLQKQVADTSELFLRAAQLIGLCRR